MDAVEVVDVVPHRPWKEVCVSSVSFLHTDTVDLVNTYGCHLAQVIAYLLAHPQEVLDRAYRHDPYQHPVLAPYAGSGRRDAGMQPPHAGKVGAGGPH